MPGLLFGWRNEAVFALMTLLILMVCFPPGPLAPLRRHSPILPEILFAPLLHSVTLVFAGLIGVIPFCPVTWHHSQMGPVKAEQHKLPFVFLITYVC